ncbi:hypothetical protein U9M48_033516 [Paspalum notatum var. saurae]|uniref:DUF4378 domain-containing protein n=1 Tax=Paspalum notatum var. saurae TaxID=547442 RepID=A0AAQ3UA91_PASNO
MELEWRPGQPLMLKEWLELESSAELSRDGFGCYPRQLAAELRSRSASCRRGRVRNGHVVARVSAAVRAALSRPPPSTRQAEPAALTRSLSRTLRVVGFWKRRKGEVEVDRTVESCSATAASSGRRDGTPSPAMSPRSMGWESRQAGGAGLSGGRRSHDETVKVEGCDECEATCRLDEEAREQEQRLSPVSVMDFPSQHGDDDDCNDDHGGSNGHNDDGGTSPTFERSLANIRRASQELRQRIRRFEQLAELDTSDADDATTAADDTRCPAGDELDSDDDADLLVGLPDASSPCAAHCFKKLLQDFFREGLSSRHAGGVDDDPGVEEALLETAKAWLDGRRRALRSDDGNAEVEEVERLGRWRCFREDEQEPLSSDVEDSIFWSLVEELVEELC